MILLAALLTVILLLVAVLHAIWGLKIWWPIADERRLARTVVGAREIEEMPAPFACFLVAVALLIGITLPWITFGYLALPFGPSGLYLLALGGFAAVLLLRGVAGYTTAFRRIFPEEPFRSLDRRFFSPLCLALGAGYATLFFGAVS